MFNKKTNKTESEAVLVFSPVLLVFALVALLVLIIIIAPLTDSARSQTPSDSDGTGKQTEETSDQANQEIIARLETELDQAKQDLESLRIKLTELSESDDISAAVLGQLRSDLEKYTSTEKIYEDIIAALAEQGISCIYNENTNALRFDQHLLFASSSSDLTDNDKDFLLEIYPVINQILLESDQSDRIRQVVFTGFADDGGTLDLNLSLSHQRSEAVVSFLSDNNLIGLNIENGSGFTYTVSGLADQNPIMKNGSVNRDLSRRVELSILLDYSNLGDLVFGDD